MGDVASQSKAHWRIGAVIGVTIALCLIVSKTVEKTLTPHLGDWGAFGVSIISVAVVAGLIGLVAQAVARK